MARKYSNTFLQTTLSGSINNSVTTITVASTTGLPATFPYTLVIEPETATIEIVTVTAQAGSNLTVTRGEDGTSAQSHNAGSVVWHAVTARDLREPQEHIDASTNVHGLSGGAAVVGTTQTQTLTNKTISGASNTLSNIGNASISDLAASKLTGNFNAITSTGAITGTSLSISGNSAITGNETVGGTLGVTGATTLAACSCTTLSASGNATVTGTLGVTGTTTCGQINCANLSVSNSATITNDLTVTDDVTVGGDITVTGNMASSGIVSGLSISSFNISGTTINGTTDMQFNGTSLPRGMIGGKRYTTAATLVGPAAFAAEAITNVDSGSVTMVSGRAYMLRVRLILTSTVVTDDWLFHIRDTNAAGTRRAEWTWRSPNITWGHEVEFSTLYKPSGNETKTFVVTASRLAGSGNLTIAVSATNHVHFLVEDVGLAASVTDV